MEYQKIDLLTYQELNELIITFLPDDRAKIIVEKLKKYVVYSNGNIYKFDREQVLYNLIDITEKEKESSMKTYITSFINDSYKNLSEAQKNELQKNKGCKNFFKTNSITDYFSQIKTYLTVDINISNPHTNEIHFKNGYYNFKTNKFEKREFDKHFITYCINHDYEPSSKESREEVMSILRKIYPNKEDLDYILTVLSSAMTGMSTEDQTVLFLLGRGNTGKSTILNVMKACFEDYILTLKNDIFSQSSKTVDKTLNSYLQRRYTRISHINEPDDSKMNASLFKDFVDGNIASCQLYKEGCKSFSHFSKMIVSSNTMPKFKFDTGMARRIESYEHSSLFTQDSTQVNESKNIYLENKRLKDTFYNTNFRNAVCDIIFEYARYWITKEKTFTKSKNFQNTKSTILSVNDDIGEFIEKYLIKTERGANDRIQKNEMFELFRAFKPNTKKDDSELMGGLKQAGLEYEADKRKNGIKGCFIGVLIKDSLHEDYNQEKEEEEKQQLDYKALYLQSQKQIEELMKKIKELEDAKTTKHVETKPIETKPIETKPVELSEEELEEELTRIPKKVRSKAVPKKVIKVVPNTRNVVIESDDEDSESEDEGDIKEDINCIKNFIEKNKNKN